MDIRKLRLDKGYTQRHCAIFCEVSVTAWQNWEYGHKKPSMKKLKRIIELFER